MFSLYLLFARLKNVVVWHLDYFVLLLPWNETFSNAGHPTSGWQILKIWFGTTRAPRVDQSVKPCVYWYCCSGAQNWQIRLNYLVYAAAIGQGLEQE
jgi:hypothetical protein